MFDGSTHAARIWLLAALLVCGATPAGGVDSEDAAATRFDDRPRARDTELPAWFKASFLDLREDLHEATIEGGKQALIVYFHQDNCAYCEALLRVNFAKEDIRRYTREHFDVVAIDIWGSREVVDPAGRRLTEREYAVRERTNFTPSMIFYDADAREALRLRGYYPPYRFRAALEYVAGGHYRDESFRDYLARADPPPKFDLGDLNERDFFIEPPYVLDRSRAPAERPLVVFFESRDCHACDVLHSEPLSDPRTLELLSSFEPVQLDMWSDTPVITPSGERTTAMQWAAELDLFYAPTLVFFDESGQEILRLDSVVRLYRLRKVLEYVLEKGYLVEPVYHRWLRTNID